MQPEKRRTIESFFRSFKKKPRTDEQEIELNVNNTSSSSLEFQNLPSSSSDNQVASDVGSATPSSSFGFPILLSPSSDNQITSDTRLSDLKVLAVERDIVIDYERVVDKFARNHKNSRILLC